LVFSDYSLLWSRPFHFNALSSKTAKTTTWIWNLHSSAHDYSEQSSTQAILARKVFSSNIAHLGFVFLFLSAFHFDGAYFSNYLAWTKDPNNCTPSAHVLWALVGQDLLNQDVGAYFQGIQTTSGVFNLWRAEGLITHLDLKYASTGSLFGVGLFLILGYYYMHCSYASSFTTTVRITYHYLILLGLGSLAWSGHCIHIGIPSNCLLDSGIDPAVIPCPSDLMLNPPIYKDTLSDIIPLGQELQQSLFERLLNPSVCCIELGIVLDHHVYVFVVLVISGSILSLAFSTKVMKNFYLNTNSQMFSISINLFLLGLSSLIHAYHSYALPVYPYLSPDFPSVLSLIYHHIILAGFLIVGSASHLSMFVIRDWALTKDNAFLILLFSSRDLILGCLVYIVIVLGFHSFGIYIHNDTLSALGRQEDMFQDHSIQLKPFFANLAYSCFRVLAVDSSNIIFSDKKVALISQELGTADLMVDHIHAFTCHTTSLVMLKGILYARGSRLLSAKLELGWIYPCDGPGRGGTCQISPYDHVYLAAFWAYNCISVVLFHCFWKQISDIWGSVLMLNHESDRYLSCKHLTGGEFSIHATTINGWLRNLLWSGSSQAIQSYGTTISEFGLIFIGSHFIWSFSLMFLFSGRGYWQEYIESIVWSHLKVKIINLIKPRALSISQGRSVGLVHYLVGGIGCTFSFVLSRIITLA